MPLYDHFRPPWSVRRPWEGFHGAWATSIAYHLNGGILPADYFAMPLLEVSGRVEVDVGTFEEGRAEAPGTLPATWTPPQPALTLPLEVSEGDTFEVQVLRNFGGPQLRAAIELVSPGNKDRAPARRSFAEKCAGYLRRGVSVIVIDIVTERLANLHAEILRALEGNGKPAWESPTHLYAVAYRGVREGKRAWRRGRTPSHSDSLCRKCRCGWRKTSPCRCGWKRATWSHAARCAWDGESTRAPSADTPHSCVSAISSARSSPLALFSVSSRSFSGTLSATMPAPACKYAVCPLSTSVRRVMHVSMLPLKST